MPNLPDHNSQKAQLSWLQSSNGEWFYFFDDNAVEKMSLEKVEPEYIWLVCQGSTSHKVSGYRIENHMIETLIEQLAAVNQAVVFGVPHEHKGNGIHVHVELNAATLDLSLLSEAISAKIAGFFGEFVQPEAVHFVDELSNSHNKKACRQILKSQTMSIRRAA
jgi:acetyl-CoA synthetase